MIHYSLKAEEEFILWLFCLFIPLSFGYNDINELFGGMTVVPFAYEKKSHHPICSNLNCRSIHIHPSGFHSDHFGFANRTRI